MQGAAQHDGGQQTEIQSVSFRLQDIAYYRAELDGAYQEAGPLVDSVVLARRHADHADHADERVVGYHLPHCPPDGLRDADVLAHEHRTAQPEDQVAHDDRRRRYQPRYHVRQALHDKCGRDRGEAAGYALRNAFS